MKRFAILVYFLVPWAMTASAADFAAGMTAYENGDFKRAFEIWKPLADTGDPSSQFQLGGLYDRGEGTEKNYGLARKWYEKAAEQGNSDAMFNLGNLFFGGKVIERRFFNALYWFSRAVKLDHLKAHHNLALLLHNGGGEIKPDIYGAIYFYELAAEKGFAGSAFNLGLIYLRGIREAKIDKRKAIMWFKRSAELGLPEGKYYWAGLLEGKESAFGFDADVALQNFRFNLYLQAANAGYAPSQFAVAFYYEFDKNHYAEPDYVNAALWYKRASDQNHSRALFRLAGLYSLGIGVQLDRRLAMKLANRSSRLGNIDADKLIDLLLDTKLTSLTFTRTVCYLMYESRFERYERCR